MRHFFKISTTAWGFRWMQSVLFFGKSPLSMRSYQLLLLYCTLSPNNAFNFMATLSFCNSDLNHSPVISAFVTSSLGSWPLTVLSHTLTRPTGGVLRSNRQQSHQSILWVHRSPRVPSGLTLLYNIVISWEAYKAQLLWQHRHGYHLRTSSTVPHKGQYFKSCLSVHKWYILMKKVAIHFEFVYSVRLGKMLITDDKTFLQMQIWISYKTGFYLKKYNLWDILPLIIWGYDFGFYHFRIKYPS